MPRMLPVRQRRSRTSPRTSSAQPPTRSRPRARLRLKARARGAAGSSAAGSATISPMQFANLCLMINDDAMTCAGLYLLVNQPGFTQNASAGFHASSQPTHVDQEVQFFLEVNIPLNIGSRSVQMRGRHSAVKIHMNDRMHALPLASGKLSRQRILLDSAALNRHTSKRRVSIHHQAVSWSYPPW